MSARRAPAAGHEESGGAWKVAFADLCLVLMCLFVVMWVLERRVFEAPQPAGPEVSEALQAARGAPLAGLPSGQFESPADLVRLASAVQQLSEAADLSDHVSTSITPDGLRVRLSDSDERGLFERGSATPSSAATSLLSRIGQLFSGIDNSLMIVGHTDAVRYRATRADSYTNWHLSSDRALAARTALVAGGLPLERVLMSVGMADHAPLRADDPTAATNRRIEFVVLTQARARQLATMFGASHAGEVVITGRNAQADAAAMARGQASLTSGAGASPGSSEP
ncbi:OmpA family protein [Pandoraea nosoerga]|uniref:Chemotaxis lafU protein n=1 Tax=Pandoraea nosoerga TaxID=2508296 RepID=A0A5E4WFV5_9BURK|nr:OmpA family protein [Pandoraea nosoerga]MBN4667385.1 OmpA family protein [Pandoraea nosoerga]MBN4677299.1 OmpA family protein [Pandoraea nosoerga]MBN4682420.1 OmpA family protein [Pandoraea nosoerga]MBN4746783.1 OmpA family protein [Pandoraea nosoerga]VVE22639.1 chemotaxis lafU protein [Pandoraea nosoerga]